VLFGLFVRKSTPACHPCFTGPLIKSGAMKEIPLAPKTKVSPKVSQTPPAT